MLDDKAPEAQKIGGIVGFVATKVRTDAALGYVLLAPYLRLGALAALPRMGISPAPLDYPRTSPPPSTCRWCSRAGEQTATASNAL